MADKEIKLSLVLKDKFTATIKKAEHASKGLGAVLATIGKIGAIALGAITVAVGLAIAAIGALAMAVKAGIDAWSSYVGKIAAVRSATGLTARASSQLVGQVRLLGMDVDLVTRGMAYLAKNLYAAQKGNKTMAKNFRDLGVRLRDSKGHLLTMSEVLPKVRAEFSKMAPGARKTALAMALFGRSGKELFRYLNAKNIDELNAKLRQMQLIFGPRALKRLKEYRMAQAEMKLAWDAVKIALGAALGPIVTVYLNKLSKWVAGNMPTIKGWFDRVAVVVRQIANWVANNLVSAFNSLKAWVATNGPGIIAMLQTVLSVAQSIAAALRTVASISPWGSAGAGDRTMTRRIGKHARGAVVTRPEVALVGEGGPEAIIPLTGSGGGVGASVVLNNCTLVGSGPDAGRAIARVLDDYYRRRARGA